MLQTFAMTCARKLLLLVAMGVALHGAVACGSSGTELNPQPLPPSEPTAPESPAADKAAGTASTADAGADAIPDGGDAADADHDGGDR